jgi:SAM-dependent methyltransferase
VTLAGHSPAVEPEPTSFDSGFHGIVDEIVCLTGLPPAEVERRVWREALQTGTNVLEDMARFDVEAHVYDAAMERLYRQGDGFIFETLVYWLRPERQKWTKAAIDRLRLHAEAKRVHLPDLKILMLGDGTGSDAILLAKCGCRVVVFDVPGSKVMEFAIRRFRSHGLLGNEIEIVESYDRCLTGEFDAVISFEVLEHLSDPVTAIRDIGRMLKLGGIALITEAFGGIDRYLPTHLLSNRRYYGQTAYLFHKNSMKLRWYNKDPLFKPIEFVKKSKAGPRDLLALVSDRSVLKAWIDGRVFRMKQMIKATLHAS